MRVKACRVGGEIACPDVIEYHKRFLDGNSIFMQHKPENKHALTASYVGEWTGSSQTYRDQKNDDMKIDSDVVHVTHYIREPDEITSKRPRAVGRNKINYLV
jgi:hypothetical protein